MVPDKATTVATPYTEKPKAKAKIFNSWHGISIGAHWRTLHHDLSHLSQKEDIQMFSTPRFSNCAVGKGLW